ncbi:Fms-interacting protein-domain-containing protein [Earliella scabrosa]|nr:Fms-interacting protein-domain-containing protein [Earliella scabrosa]
MSPTHDDLLPPSPDKELDALRDLVSSAYLNHDPSLVNIRAGALFARLKALNRAANHATRAHKNATADARHEMDQTYLSLQNLLYEKRHLEREIEKCRQFASVYQDIPVHSLDEFLRLAPEEARNGDVLADDHQLMLNRLSFELSERQRLDLKRKELLKQKEALLRESKAKLATMETVKAHIDTLMKTATEVRKKVHDLVQPIETAQDPDATTAAT